VALLLRAALELLRRLGQIAHEVLDLLLEVLLGNLLRLALETSALRHLAVDAAGGDEGGEEVLAKLRIRHCALDVRLERVRRQRGVRLGLRHAWYHLSSTRLRSMSATIARVRALLFFALHPKRLLMLIAGVVSATLYVWVAAVRAVPGVQERKTAMRRAWRERDRKRP
jgi:hypothetical protein